MRRLIRNSKFFLIVRITTRHFENLSGMHTENMPVSMAVSLFKKKFVLITKPVIIEFDNRIDYYSVVLS